MNFLAWIIVGLVAGLLARWIVRDDKSGCLYTVVVGVLGALIGGALMQAAGKKGIANEFDIRSILVAAVGAVLLLLVLQAIGGRSRRR
ncbi:MAG: GlsB/YeaQ/YmgE family stress response membrane protein [Actinomycetota bacterium]|nr:GlsB/YeaQ/YmgE family stress response membrane protein [Actinomycetota bacterium]